MISKLYFRLLPVQVLLVAISAFNGLISGLFAGNFAGEDTLSAMGLFNPVTMLITAVGMIMLTGTQVLTGKFMGRNQSKEIQSVFSLDILIITIAGAVLAVLILIAGLFRLVDFAADSASVREAFYQYLIGQAVGVLPFLLGQQLFAFLALEQQNRRTNAATVVSLIVNLLLNILFVLVLKMGSLGIALAPSIGNWVFMLILAQYFLRKKASLKFTFKGAGFQYLKDIIRTGLAGALLPGYQVVRGLICNALILKYVGPGGLSAFSASNAFLGIIWAIPSGMQVVGRILLSVFEGEEDRRSLGDVMRTMLFRCIPLIIIVDIIVMALAVPLTNVFLSSDATPAVYQMTVNAFRILPFGMPFSIFVLHFVSYGQISGKHVIVHIDTAFDGVICVAGFSAILIPVMGMNGFYLANIINGVVTVLIFVIYSFVKRKSFPVNMEQLMVIPDDFGALPENCMELSLRCPEDVTKTSVAVQNFCREHRIDEKKAFYSALCLEEMAGNILEHGFTKDNKPHTVDVRVVYNEETLILRIKDDCRAFDPAERKNITDPEDPCKNIGIRMVYSLADDIDYQHLLGLNVLTMQLDH